MNGLLGEKLGLIDSMPVMVRNITTVVPICTSCQVEPVTPDDWEILDRHTGFIESNLMNKLRIVQKGAVYPVWVDRVCIFIKIANISPEHDCVKLVNETEVHVMPKVRGSLIGQTLPPQPIRTGLNLPLTADDEENMNPKFNSIDSDESNRQPQKNQKQFDLSSSISSHWKYLVGYLGFNRGRIESRMPASDDEDDFVEEDYMEPTDMVLPPGLNLVLRVQNLRYTVNEADLLVPQPPYSRQGSESPRKGTRTSPRKQSQEASSKSRSTSQPNAFKRVYVPHQPSTVYMDMSDVEKQLKIYRSEIPHVFLAKMYKLSSPKEQQQEKSTVASNKNGASAKNGGKETGTPSVGTPHGHGSDQDYKKDESYCIVRVIVIDRRRQLSAEHYTDIVRRILKEQPLLKGHVIIPDMLRRFLKLDVTGRVWIQTIKPYPETANVFALYPLGNLPTKTSSDMIDVAFRHWLNTVASEEYPMVVFQGLFLRFQLMQDSYIECQLTFNNPTSRGTYTLLHPGVVRGVTLRVVSGSRHQELTPPVIQSMLAYNSISSLDPYVPSTSLDCLGGFESLVDLALWNVEVALGSRRLYRDMFLTTPGLLNGMLLITGPKGSGKTTLVQALCNELTRLPNLAYTMCLDCKPLRGKKVDTVQMTFEIVFDEAAWRQPALIVLDDLDHLAGAPAGPEFEMTGEAQYAARIAEVLKDLLRKEVRNLSQVAVVATTKSRSSLHSILVSSRGTHLVQEVLSIGPPDRTQRKAILQTILEKKKKLSSQSIEGVDLDLLAQRTEGYVARDIENVINRAIHASLLSQGRGPRTETVVELSQHDFDAALHGFTPASIRNVPLHEAGDMGWDDIGGLTEVKKTLVETLQWPSKYPRLFANCPLRLRSGLLLYGAPGTGKTLLAGVVAKECGLNFISIKGPELLSKYIGASEQAVRDTFVRAQSAKPCILFFDEFDSIAPRRGHDNTGVTDRVVNQLLTQLDGVEGLDGVYVLAATSRPDLIDPALLRPGRLDKCLLCRLPNESERLNILKALSKKVPLSDDVDLQHFADSCKDFTGADFKALLYNAQLESIHEYTTMVEAGSDSLVAQYGSKPRKEGASRMKQAASLRVNVAASKRQRHRSGSTLAYIPSLEEGITMVTAEIEERINHQVTEIHNRERRISEPFLLNPESPHLTKSPLMVTQAHLLSAQGKMRPSVSGEERAKYQRIYENFMSSRGKHFDQARLDTAKMRATLA
ncbi:peroxisome biogenesis factor 1-like isoform X2 [Dreissena polymorpha]|nr:peroxisome biogenesis factor 1-like isoform X2 [Dreissena polymorpha]